MAAITEDGHAGGFLLSVANGTLSIDNGILARGENLKAGAVVALVDDEFVELAPGASDDSADAAGILFDAVDATTAAKACAVVVRSAEVIGDELVWPTGATDGQKTTAIADLAALQVVVR